MAFDTILIRWYIQQMVKHGKALMATIMAKMKRPGIYVLRWQRMGSILME
jgi:hypothetical protein